LQKQNLVSLVEELQKRVPDQIKVKELFEKLSLPFTSDPIEQMATVLVAIDQKQGAKKDEASL
jgi:hypothetical protein